MCTTKLDFDLRWCLHSTYYYTNHLPVCTACCCCDASPCQHLSLCNCKHAPKFCNSCMDAKKCLPPCAREGKMCHNNIAGQLPTYPKTRQSPGSSSLNHCYSSAGSVCNNNPPPLMKKGASKNSKPKVELLRKDQGGQ
jgi:hypothetical protein